MNDWLHALRHVLEGSSRPITFFFRDDDAGRSDEALRTLIEIFHEKSVPLDLAVIPRELTAPLAKELRGIKRDRADLLGLHQHGFAHVNHELSGRKCEFGDSRPRFEQLHDIELGRETLRARLGTALDSIFTPPWNRCSQTTADCLVALGYLALSRDRTAAPLSLGTLLEISIDVDWCRRRNGARIEWPELGQWIANAAQNAPQVGIMLHHESLDEGDHRALRHLLDLLAHHTRARCRLMRELSGAGLLTVSTCSETG